jgi:hypothetical protein
MARPTYFFGNGRSDGNAGMKALLGAGGAHKCEMANLGLPVAPGFCVTPKCLQTAGCDEGYPVSADARNDIKLALNELEGLSERRFGNLVDPLLLSIEGGVKVPMPGFTGTIANIGLNDDIVQAWSGRASPHFVWDTYRRLIVTFARVVRKLDMEPFDQELKEVKKRLNDQCQLGRQHADCHIPTHELRTLVARYKGFFEEQTGEHFPQEPERQLWEAVHAASCSWDRDTPSGCPSPVTVQSTVFSNYDFKSAVGVTYSCVETDEDEDAFVPEVHGHWVVNAQSEDMTGTRTPQLVTQEASCQWAARRGVEESQRKAEYPSLEEAMPGIYAQLLRWQDKVENHFEGVQGLEFAVHQGKLWVLHAHTGEQGPPEAMDDRCAMPVQMHDCVDTPSDAELGLQQEADVGVQPPASDSIFDIPPASVEPDNVWSIKDDTASCESTDSTQAPSYHQSDAWEEDSMDSTTCPEMQVSTQLTVPVGQGFCKASVPTHKARVPVPTVQQVMQRLASRGRKVISSGRKALSRRSGPHRFDPASKAEDRRWLAMPCGLAVWQTGLAGGSAAMTCRAMALSIKHVTAGNSLNLLRNTSLQTGYRCFLAPAGPARAFPFGALCCTLYTNLCCVSPADDRQSSCAPLWRLGCAATAVSSAAMLTHGTASLIAGKRSFRGLAPGLSVLSTIVPTMAIEMCVIDLVRNAAVARGHDVSPGVLIASGAVAGTVAQTVMHPLNALCQADAPLKLAPSAVGPGSCTALRVVAKEGAASLFAGAAPAALRSMPVVAMNSLVRVGMVTHFMNLSAGTS